LDDRHQAKLADLGLAVDVAQGYSNISGTPPYMAPEIFRNPSEADHRVDYFALGVTLHELLTGDSRISGLSFIEAEIGKEVADLVRGLCEKEPGSRLTDPQKVEDQFTRLLRNAAEQKVVIPSDWPRVDSNDSGRLVQLAEEAEPLLQDRLTVRLGLFIGKHEVLQQLRYHRNVVNQLKWRLSLLIKQLLDVEGVLDEKRIELIKKEVEKGLDEFDDARYSESQRPSVAQFSQLRQDQSLTIEFRGLLETLGYDTTRIKSDLILSNGLSGQAAAEIRIDFEKLWSLLDDYCVKVDDRLRTCADQLLAVVEILERGK
jgi:serine/threonine protein kinase